MKAYILKNWKSWDWGFISGQCVFVLFVGTTIYILEGLRLGVK